MAVVKGVESRTVNFEIDKKQALIALAQELNVYNLFKNTYGQYFKIKDEKIYSYEDVSRHGSPCYDESLYSDNELAVKNYKYINEISKINNINLTWL